MARPHDYSALPAHPAVSAHYKKMRKYGYTTVAADVTCPTCRAVRSFPLYTLRQQMAKAHFNGQCKKCGQQASRAAATATLRNKYKHRRRVMANGYVAMNSSAVPEADLWLFESMRGKGTFVSEHRLSMARAIGRPLQTNELVDHMDGNKQNNDPANLRLYLKGKNQPGSHNGYGTYYHEWQLAEARNMLLQAELEKLRSATT